MRGDGSVSPLKRTGFSGHAAHAIHVRFFWVKRNATKHYTAIAARRRHVANDMGFENLTVRRLGH